MLPTPKVILAGYEGSKRILTASSYLINKYLTGFDVYFLNYGDFDGKLYCGKYVKLAEHQMGGADNWSKYIREYLKTLDDEYIIFALDDYLLSNKLKFLPPYEGFDCINLCSNSDPKDEKYSCTTQYTIWRRTFLIEVLEQVGTPWEFELNGSRYVNGLNKRMAWAKALDYPDCSSLSSKWEGVRLIGNEKDIKVLNKLL